MQQVILEMLFYDLTNCVMHTNVWCRGIREAMVPNSNSDLHVQDMQVLHSQERKLVSRNKGWRDYYLATQSDAGVSAFWRWLATYAGLPSSMWCEHCLSQYQPVVLLSLVPKQSFWNVVFEQ